MTSGGNSTRTHFHAPSETAPACIFGIRECLNIYEPCPKCHATTGIGLTSRPGRLFVHCNCGHVRPEVEAPAADQWVTWPVPWHERDRLAFEAWNKASVAAR